MSPFGVELSLFPGTAGTPGLLSPWSGGCGLNCPVKPGGGLPSCEGILSAFPTDKLSFPDEEDQNLSSSSSSEKSTPHACLGAPPHEGLCVGSGFQITPPNSLECSWICKTSFTLETTSSVSKCFGFGNILTRNCVPEEDPNAHPFKAINFND